MKGEQWSRWDMYWKNTWTDYPTEHLVRFVRKMFNDTKGKRALDLGAGVGTNSILLAEEGFKTYAIDASHFAVKRMKSRFEMEGLDVTVCEGNMTKLPYPDNYFNCVIDIASIQHNKRSDIMMIINEVRRVLKPKGRFFSMMRTNWDYLYGNGLFVEKGTFHDIPGGDLKGIDITHFFSLEELEILFNSLDEKKKPFFRDVRINYTERSVDSMRDRIAMWLIECRK